MAQIGLIDVDGHNFPNLALMKISAWHKAQGDHVEWYFGELKYYDIVYMSKVFDSTYSPDIPEPYINVGKVTKGGTGYGLDNWLPDEIEHIMPDYSLYSITDTAYGFLTRGCPRNCPFCIVTQKEGRKSRKVADLSEWWHGQKNIVLLDPNLLACREHMELLAQLLASGAAIDYTQGLDARMVDSTIAQTISLTRYKEIHFAWDNMAQSKKILAGLEMFAGYAKRKPHGYYASVYILTNYNTTMEENLIRIYTLRQMGFDPYVMIYDKPTAPQEVRNLQGWVNNKRIWSQCERFDDYRRTITCP